jgi:hypothetical protein
MVLGTFFEPVSIGLLIPFIAVLKEPDLLFKTEHVRALLSNLNISPAELIPYSRAGPDSPGRYQVRLPHTAVLLALPRRHEEAGEPRPPIARRLPERACICSATALT